MPITRRLGVDGRRAADLAALRVASTDKPGTVISFALLRCLSLSLLALTHPSFTNSSHFKLCTQCQYSRAVFMGPEYGP